MIVKTGHVTSPDVSDFHERVLKLIRAFQDAGLKVEVQYQPVNTKDEYERIIYTAYVIGRKKGGE